MTRPLLLRIALPAAIALTSVAAGAETVWRCGNAYSQSPCATARAIEVDDSRSADVQAHAMRIASAERRLGDRMEQQRLADEARVRPAKAVEMGAVTKPAAAAARPATKKRRGARPSWATSEAIAIDAARPRGR